MKRSPELAVPNAPMPRGLGLLIKEVYIRVKSFPTPMYVCDILYDSNAKIDSKPYRFRIFWRGFTRFDKRYANANDGVFDSATWKQYHDRKRAVR